MNKKQITGLSLVSLFVFALILIFVLLGKTSLDYSISSSILKIQTPSLSPFFIFLGNYSEGIMTAMALFFGVVLYLKKRKKQSFVLIFSLCFGYAIKEIIKSVVQRERPLNQLLQETGYSFPSGHAVFSVILFSMLIYFYKDEIKNKAGKILLIAGGIFLIILIGFSRIYLNVHWFTDVIGGYALGFFLFNLGILFLKKKI